MAEMILRQRFYHPDPELDMRLSGDVALIKEEFPMSREALRLANRDLFLELAVNLAEGLQANHAVSEDNKTFHAQIQLPDEQLEEREKQLLTQLLVISDRVSFRIKNDVPLLTVAYKMR